MIEELKKRLAQKSIGLVITPEVKKWLIKKGFDPKNGARPLRRAIEDNIEALISEEIINGKVNAGDIVKISLVRDKLKLGVTRE